MMLLPADIFRMYALCGLLVMSFHLAMGLVLSPAPKTEVQALSGVPLYILRKLSMLPKTLRASRAHAAWVRTSRAPWTRGTEGG